MSHLQLSNRVREIEEDKAAMKRLIDALATQQQSLIRERGNIKTNPNQQLM